MVLFETLSQQKKLSDLERQQSKVKEVRDEVAPEIMAGVGMDNERLLPIHWFTGDTGSMNGKQYLNMIKKKVWLL